MSKGYISVVDESAPYEDECCVRFVSKELGFSSATGNSEDVLVTYGWVLNLRLELSGGRQTSF